MSKIAGGAPPSSVAPTAPTPFRRAFGPGLLFAAIAIGASHLVHSTRAGAAFGLALVAVIVLTNVVKYPAFRFGVAYASETGESLLAAYLKQGRWAIAAYALVALGTMFAAEAAVTLVTVGLIKAVTGSTMGDGLVAAIILLCSLLVLTIGGYRLLDRIIKGVMLVLAFATLAATIAVLPRVDWSTLALFPASISPADWMFLAALVGFMPTSVDISVFHSLWAVSKAKEMKARPPHEQSIWDFHIGYVGTIFLAVCFVLLGAGVMHGEGIQFESGAAAFASQLIDLYAQTLGEWSRPVLGTAAVAVMFSTVLAGLDGYPRAAAALAVLSTQSSETPAVERERRRLRVYRIVIVVHAVGAFLILLLFSASLRWLVDMAATLAFLFAPIVGWLNHRAILSLPLESPMRPSVGLQVWSIASIVTLLALGVGYLILRF